MKIPMERGRYYRKIWYELFDGGSDQWLWVVRDSLAYIFLEIQDLPGYMGSEAPARWNASVCVVDLLSIGPGAIAGAMRSCSCEDELDFKSETDRLRIAEMLYSVGNKAPMWNSDGGKVTFDSYGNREEDYDENCIHFRGLRKEAREYAEEELFDEESRNRLLDTTVVNKIGQTARSYMSGTAGLWDAIRNIKDNPEATDEQKIVLKMYQNAGTTLGAGPVPADIMEKKE